MRRRRASSGYVFCRQCRTDKTLDAKTCDICGTSLIWQPAQARRADASVGQDAFLGDVFSGLYRIEELISRDPNASLYRAIDIHGGKSVALKILAPMLSNDSVLMNRLRLEVQKHLHLDHPHIAQVKGVVTEGDYRAIISQFISGISLDQLLYDLSRPMDLAAIKSLLLPILEAVAYAHQFKIQHLGIKPANIMLESSGSRSHPYLTDFGISSFIAQGGARTSPGIVPGTLMYLSPEQCKALKSIDYRADIYALGVILYQMATGVVPFRAESAFEIMLAHVKDPSPNRRTSSTKGSVRRCRPSFLRRWRKIPWSALPRFPICAAPCRRSKRLSLRPKHDARFYQSQSDRYLHRLRRLLRLRRLVCPPRQCCPNRRRRGAHPLC